jgi:hypothetical protein
VSVCVDHRLAGLPQARAGVDGVLTVDVVVAPAPRGELQELVPPLVASIPNEGNQARTRLGVDGHDPRL